MYARPCPPICLRQEFIFVFFATEFDIGVFRTMGAVFFNLLVKFGGGA